MPTTGRGEAGRCRLIHTSVTVNHGVAVLPIRLFVCSFVLEFPHATVTHVRVALAVRCESYAGTAQCDISAYVQTCAVSHLNRGYGNDTIQDLTKRKSHVCNLTVGRATFDHTSSSDKEETNVGCRR